MTDRPDFTESTVVVDPGSVQLEAGLTRTTPPGDEGAEVSGPELLARIGLARVAEVRLGGPTWTRSGGALPRTASDHRWSTGVKVQVLRGGKTGLAFLAAASFRLGGGDDLPLGVATAQAVDDASEASYELRMVISREVGDLSLAAMTSLVAGTETRTGQTLVASHPLAGRSAGFLEYSGCYGGFLEAEHTVHGGVAWPLADDLQVDLHAGRVLGGGGATFVGAGLAVRFR